MVDLWFEGRKVGSRLALPCVEVFLGKKLNPILLLVVICWHQCLAAELSPVCLCMVE